MSSVEQQLQILESEQLQIKKDINFIQKKISLYGFSDCSKKDLELKKVKIQSEINNIQQDIAKATSKNDRDTVLALKNKEGILKTHIMDINNTLVLFDERNQLKKIFFENEEKIDELKKLVKTIYTERQLMDKFLNIFQTKSCKQAAHEANIDVKRIVNWLHEGRDGTTKNKIYFYKQFNKIRKEKSRKKRKIEKMRNLISLLKQYESITEACKSIGISVNTFNDWYVNGRNGNGKENIMFYEEIKRIEKHYIILMRKILELMSSGKTRLEASKIVDVPISTVNLWYDQGKYGYSDETVYFYRELKSIEQSVENIQRVKMDKVLNYLTHGKSLSFAAENAGVSLDVIQEWYGQGALGYSKNTIYFYKKYNKINFLNKKKSPATLSYSEKSKSSISVDDKLYCKDDEIKININNSNKMKSCPNCSSKVTIGDKYCQKCGYKFDNLNKNDKQTGFLSKIQSGFKKWF